MSQLLDKVSDTIKSLGDKDKITDAKQKMDDALESLNQTAGDTTGSMFDGLSELADKTKEIAEDPIFSVLPGALSGMGEAFRENGFTGGVETVSTLIQLLSSIGGED
jgi:ElaB/YqjD/DUF883 family membrane-anchored ribosome-binding protein